MPTFHVESSIDINAPAERVFDTVADFGTWTTWSPWLCADPDANVSVSDDSHSVGSLYAWQGDVVGQGEMEHIRLDRPNKIDEEIRFLKPFKSQSAVNFTLKPSTDGTNITWNMDSSLPWFLFWMKSSMVAYIGMDYARGLKMLKELVETGQVLSKTEILGVEETPARSVVGRSDSSEIGTIGDAMTSVFAEVQTKLDQAEVHRCGEAISIYHASSDLKQNRFDFTSGYVVPPGAKPPAGLVSRELPARKSLHLCHTGSYDNLGNAWSAAYQYARYKKVKIAKADSFEIYRNDPSETPVAELVTDLYLPIR